MSEENSFEDIFGNLQNSLENRVELNEREFLFANLIYKTDFEPDEIIEILEWEPDEEEMERIRERVYEWRSPDEYNDILLL